MTVTVSKPELDVRTILEKSLPQTQSSYIAHKDIYVVSGDTYTFDLSKGDIQKVFSPPLGTMTIAFDNFIDGEVSNVIIDAVNWGNTTISYADNMIFSAGVAPVFSALGTDRLCIIKDSANAYSLFVLGYNIGYA